MKERVFTRARLSAVFTTGAVLLGSITLAACSTASTSPPAARAAPAPRALSATESGIENRAELLLTRDCMAEHGFRYWPMPQVPLPGYRTFDYVVDDVAWAAQRRVDGCGDFDDFGF